MAGGKWRERLRRARDRLLRRQAQYHHVEDSPTYAPCAPPFQQVAGAPNDQHIPVIQIGPNQPSYYYPPFRLQDNLGGHHAPNQATFDLTLPVPSWGTSPGYPTRSSPKNWTSKSASLRGSSPRSSYKSSSPKPLSPERLSHKSSSHKSPSHKTSSSAKTSGSDPQPDQPTPKTKTETKTPSSAAPLVSSPASTRTQRGSHRSSRWSFGSNRAMRAARPGISHFTADDADHTLPSGMTPPRAVSGPVTPPNSRARPPTSPTGNEFLNEPEFENEWEALAPVPAHTLPNPRRRRQPSVSGRGGYLPTPPPSPPLSPSEWCCRACEVSGSDSGSGGGGGGGEEGGREGDAAQIGRQSRFGSGGHSPAGTEDEVRLRGRSIRELFSSGSGGGRSPSSKRGSWTPGLSSAFG